MAEFSKTDERSLKLGTRKPSPPPNYFARKEQYRLLILCAMLMLVLVMMNEVRKPEMWDWMWAGDKPQIEQQAKAPIDTRAADRPKTPANAFRVARLPENQSAVAGEAANEAGEEDELLPGITSELLSPIQDNSILRVAENDVWQTILRVLQETPQGTLQAKSLGSVSFAQLYRQSDIYRGRIVSIRGTIRRAEPITPRENENGIDQLFRWIVEPAGPSNAPVVIYSLEKPPEFKITDDLREDATFTAVFFKRWAYAAGDGTRIAPLLLAKTPTWQPEAPSKPVELPANSIVATTLFGLVLLATAVAWSVYRSSKERNPDVERAREYMSRGVDQLDEREVLPSVADSLQQLADEAKQSEEHSER